MSTANVARDLDMLRQAVGDEALTYVGYSYGSFLGVTYANLFPDRVRALVVDGVLDPIAWTTGSGNLGLDAPVLDTAALGHRRAGDARRVLQALRHGHVCVRGRARLRGSRRSANG
jgi:pimeloyl-ACP methyl ester carboxylesterase